MRVTIEDIWNRYTNRYTREVKFVVIEQDNQRPIKVLVGVTYRTFRNGDFNQQVECDMIHGGTQPLYEADLAISTNITVSKFNVIKNRYGREGGDMVPYYFLNRTLDGLIEKLLTNPTIYDIQHVKAEIIRAFAMITGESFHFVGGKFMTMRDLYIQNNLIKYRTLKHNFVDARVS
jgi:hypothetical protein